MKRAILVLLVACAGAGPERTLFLDRTEVSGLNRLCFYRDWPGEYAVTIQRWESCEPEIEVDD